MTNSSLSTYPYQHNSRQRRRARGDRYCSGFGLSGFGVWKGSNESGGPGLTCAYGYHVLKGRTSALTQNAPITVGAYGKHQFSWFLVDVPAMLDVNLGDLAGNENTHLGLRVGVGWGVSYANISDDYKEDYYGYAWGLRYNAGISWRSMMLLCTWRTDHDPGTGNVFGISIIVNN